MVSLSLMVGRRGVHGAGQIFSLFAPAPHPYGLRKSHPWPQMCLLKQQVHRGCRAVSAGAGFAGFGGRSILVREAEEI